MRGKKQIHALLAAALTLGLGGCAEPPAQDEPRTPTRQSLEGVTRLRDIHTQPAPLPDFSHETQGEAFTTAGGVTYLAMFDTLAGNELWRSDGTEAGTKRVKDIAPGISSSHPSHFVELRGTVFFAASSDVGEVGLWKTDGTPAGTVPMKRLHGLDSEPSITAIATVGDTVLFIHQQQLWRSDGTEAGTVPLKSLGVERDFSFETQLVPMGGAVFFSAMDATEGMELWRTDGTAAGTTRVADLVPGERTEVPAELEPVGNSLFFTAGRAIGMKELWKTNGTPAGTVRVDPQQADMSQLTAFQGGLLLVKGGRLFYSDGTQVTPLTATGATVRELLAVGRTAYFFSHAIGDGSAPELWKTDGTGPGTVPVGDLWPGSARGFPQLFRAWQGGLIFKAATGTGRTGLWKTDGTQAGTQVLKDWAQSWTSLFPSFPRAPLTVGTSLLFQVPGAEAASAEVWRTDGTVAGTRALGGIDSRTRDSQVQVRPLAVLQGSVLFPADDGSGSLGLWKSDGTEAGTLLLKRFSEHPSVGISQAMQRGSTLFFVADDGVHGHELWKTDGTPAGTVLVKDIHPGAEGSASDLSRFVELGGALYFTGNDGTHGPELWKTDGTEAGTVLVRDIHLTAAEGSYPYGLTAMNGALYFGASTGDGPPKLWKSDGTQAGTVRFLETYANNLVAGGNSLFFTTWSNELWKSDGTPAGTVRLLDGAGPLRGMRWVKDRLYFSVENSASGNEPWVSDGTPQGTVPLGDLNPGSAHSYATGFTRLGDHVLFVAYDVAHGFELWRTDGTPAGTARVTDARPGPDSGLLTPYHYEKEGGELEVLVLEERGLALFAGIDAQAGVEPWVTDGTAQGTARWVDAAPGADSSTPLSFARMGEHVFFFAGDSAVGREPFRMPLPDRTVPVLSCPANVSVTTQEAEGARVDYPAATVVDPIGSPTLSYSQGSGTRFPVGTTSVSVSATDAAGNRGQCSFSVSVQRETQSEPPAPEQQSDSGCGCAASPTGGGLAGWGLLLAGLASVGRRAAGSSAD